MWYLPLSPNEAKELENKEEKSKKDLLSTAKTISFKSQQKDVTKLLMAISKHLTNYNTSEIHTLHKLVSECYSSIINEKENNSFNSLKDFLSKI